MHNHLISFNTRAFEFINGGVGHFRSLDIFFVSSTSYSTLAVVAVGVLSYFIFYLPSHQEGMARVRALRDAWQIIWAVLLTWIIVSLIKIVIAFPRPFQTLQNLHVLISQPSSYSFPSGHAAVTMALATAVYFHKKRLGQILFAFAFVVGMARIYVGVHYPLDVGVGFLVGYLVPKALQYRSIVFAKKTG